MANKLDPQKNHDKTRRLVGYVPRRDATRRTSTQIGFKCGLEIHQQLKTRQMRFCRCPAGVYGSKEGYDAEVVRHMRPTLSELGEYDGTALMEFKTRKTIFYRIHHETTCTYDVDDTPPFPVNREALSIALEIALLLKTSIVGELHITRKQYLDGSIPTGFQRTGIIGIDGHIPLAAKTVRILQLSLEEDACREVRDHGHERVYITDRLGMPLIETVTYPDLLTPDEAAEAAHYIRFLARSTGLVRTGIGAAREDVNVSCTGGTRVEIKGVAHIRWIPELTHNEAFRQWALLKVRKILQSRIPDPTAWKPTTMELVPPQIRLEKLPIPQEDYQRVRVWAINLPEFKEILSFFTQPGQCFADELADRVKVIACIEKPNLTHSEALRPMLETADLKLVQDLLHAGERDAQVIVWGPPNDLPTALESIEERCRLALRGVPNETRKALPDGTTIFERVLPGPDRMYPDTDSKPISISEEMIRQAAAACPEDVHLRLRQLRAWKIPADAYTFILKKNLFPLIRRIIEDFGEDPVFVGVLIGQQLKHLEGQLQPASPFDTDKVHRLFAFARERGLHRAVLRSMLPVLYEHPNMDFDSILTTIDYRPASPEDILGHIPALRAKFRAINTSKRPEAHIDWIMGQLQPLALGNLDPAELRRLVEEGNHD